MTIASREQAISALKEIDAALQKKHQTANFCIVGGTALALNGFDGYLTEDIDNIEPLDDEVAETIESTSVDLNSHSNEYMHNYRGREFIPEESEFSSISVEYLSLGDTIITRMQNIDDTDKMDTLLVSIENAFCIEEDDMTVESLSKAIEKTGYDISTEDKSIIADFLNACRSANLL